MCIARVNNDGLLLHYATLLHQKCSCLFYTFIRALEIITTLLEIRYEYDLYCLLRMPEALEGHFVVFIKIFIVITCWFKVNVLLQKASICVEKGAAFY